MKALGKLVRLKKGDLGTKRDQLRLIILKQIIKYPEQNN